jgi:hypothetical protein
VRHDHRQERGVGGGCPQTTAAAHQARTSPRDGLPAADSGARQIRHADVAVVRFSADHTTGKAAPGGANAGRSNWLY